MMKENELRMQEKAILKDIHELLDEAYDEKTGMYKPFKRFKGWPKDYNGNSNRPWGAEGPGEPFNQNKVPLSDMAMLVPLTKVREGDIIQLTDEGLNDDYDGTSHPSTKPWLEIVECHNMAERNSSAYKFWYLYHFIPVDNYGKPMTIKQVEKINPNWAKNMARRGYANYFEERIYADDDSSPTMVLRVESEDNSLYLRDDKEGNPKYREFGRSLSFNPNRPRTEKEVLYDDNDEVKRHLSSFAQRQVDEDPNYELHSYDYEDDFDEWPVEGNAEVRRTAFEKSRAAKERENGRSQRAAAKRKAWQEKYGEIHDDASNPWFSGMSSSFAKMHPEVDKDTLEKIWHEAKARGCGYGSQISDEDWEKLLTDNNIDREAIKAIGSGFGATFARAQHNSLNNGYDW